MTDEYYQDDYERERPEKTNNNSMYGIGMMAMGILVLILAFTVIPIIGSELDESTQGMLPVNSDWNNSHNPNIPTGANLWATVSGILKVTAVGLVVIGFLATIKGLKGR